MPCCANAPLPWHISGIPGSQSPGSPPAGLMCLSGVPGQSGHPGGNWPVGARFDSCWRLPRACGEYMPPSAPLLIDQSEKIPLPFSQADRRPLARACRAPVVHPQAPFRGRCGPCPQPQPCANPLLPLQGRRVGRRPDGAHGGIRHLGFGSVGLPAWLPRASDPAACVLGDRHSHGGARLPEVLRPKPPGVGPNPPRAGPAWAAQGPRLHGVAVSCGGRGAGDSGYGFPFAGTPSPQPRTGAGHGPNLGVACCGPGIVSSRRQRTLPESRRQSGPPQPALQTAHGHNSPAPSGCVPIGDLQKGIAERRACGPGGRGGWIWRCELLLPVVSPTNWNLAQRVRAIRHSFAPIRLRARRRKVTKVPPPRFDRPTRPTRFAMSRGGRPQKSSPSATRR